MVSAVVGSCVAVCIHDRRLKTGGMNQFLYPRPRWFKKSRPTPTYGNVAVLGLIKLMTSQGSRLQDLEAQIYGGGGLFDAQADIGRKNVKTARKYLKRYGIPVISEDVGGNKGRRLIFHTGTNEVLVMKTHRIRRGDYHPYRKRLEAR